MKSLKVNSILEKFKFNIIANNDAINNNIKYIGINRVGLELCGVFIHKPLECTVYLGAKESNYLKLFNEVDIYKKIDDIFKLQPPIIILGRNFKFNNIIIDVAKNHKNILVVSTKVTYSELAFTLSQYMIEEMIIYKTHHGCLLEVYGVGVFIIGSSGVGKTEVMIELIKKGHIFVADDSVDIARVGTSLWAKPSPFTKDFIEIRGLGILNFKKTFGYDKCVSKTTIDVIIELINGEKNKIDYERIGNTSHKNLDGIAIPFYKIPLLPGRNVSEIIESAITDYKLKKDGYSSKEELKNRLKSMKEKNE